MHWEAVFVIGGFSLVFGLVLYLPARWWARRRLRAMPQESIGRSRITPLGWVVYGLMTVVMMLGFSLQHLAPETWPGRFVSTSRGMLIFVVVLAAAWSALEALLASFGLRCWERPPGVAAAWEDRVEGPPPRGPGYLRIATIRGVPIWVHWSFPAGGLLVAAFGGVGFPVSLYYCLAYTALVAAHEAGHVIAARAFQLQVFSVEISGFGGLCRIEPPRQVRHDVLVYSAGLLVQAVLLLAALGYLAAFGMPAGGAGRAFAVTFTTVNLVLLLFNLVPYRSARGLATDGLMLWKFFLHAYRGAPHPLPPLRAKAPAEAPVFPPDTRLESLPGFAPPGFVHGIALLNDRTTPMNFVVTMLMRHLGLSRQQAIVRMLQIHNRGGALIPLPSAERAQSVAGAIALEAAQQGYSLVCRAVGGAAAEVEPVLSPAGAAGQGLSPGMMHEGGDR